MRKNPFSLKTQSESPQILPIFLICSFNSQYFTNLGRKAPYPILLWAKVIYCVAHFKAVDELGPK